MDSEKLATNKIVCSMYNYSKRKGIALFVNEDLLCVYKEQNLGVVAVEQDQGKFIDRFKYLDVVTVITRKFNN